MSVPFVITNDRIVESPKGRKSRVIHFWTAHPRSTAAFKLFFVAHFTFSQRRKLWDNGGLRLEIAHLTPVIKRG